MEENKPLLEMRGISKQFPGVVALDNIQFKLRQGEIHALLGENGAGKSTLIKVLTGVEHRDKGEIFLMGQPIHPRDPNAAQHLGISTVYQEVNLCSNLSVAENLYVGRSPRTFFGIDWKKINENAKSLLAKFDLDIDVTKTLDFYSVAIQQMVAIARAVDISAKVLILDEPTSSLTAVEVEKLFNIMRMLKKQGMGIIFVTHFLDQVYAVSDAITVLRNGQYIGSYQTAELSQIQLIGKMIGKDYENLEHIPKEAAASKNKDTYVSLKNASSSEISGVNLDIQRGEVCGFSGLLGSGRTEIARMLFGIDKIVSGNIQLKNSPKGRLRDVLYSIRAGLGFCPENRKEEGIIGDLSIRENIILALQTKNGMLKKMSRKKAERIAEEYIKKLEIKTPSADQQIRNLSGGNQQKVILARWLATQPELLILDEPTRGIDVGTKAEIQKMVLQFARQGMAVVFISSEIDEMLRCCSKITVLRDKKQVAEFSGSDITESAIMSSIAGGEKG